MHPIAEFDAFFRMTRPRSGLGIVATAACVFFAGCQELMFALTFMTTHDMRALRVGILGYAGEHTTGWGKRMAPSILRMIPTFLVFAVLQRQFISGLTAGAVK
ncbi:MAG: hypothetical protein NVS4B2_32150 [Chloroflexota bacterium]